MQATGIGPALRKARLIRGKSIEEASRETHIRAEYLQALERERFEALLGPVYARGFLRSYSTYLGLDADKVLTIYNRHFGQPRPTFPEPTPAPVRSPRTAHPNLSDVVRSHPSWAFLGGVALLAVGLFAATGLFRSESASGPPAPIRAAETIPAAVPPVTVALRAFESLTAIITIDGVPQEVRMERGEAFSFQGHETIGVELTRGGAVALVVNDYPIGRPGDPDAPYRATFSALDYREPPASPTMRGTASPSSQGGSPSASST